MDWVGVGMKTKEKRRSSEQVDKNGTIVFEGDILRVTTLDTQENRHFEVKYGEFQDINAITNDWTLGWYIEGGGMTFTILQEYDGERQLSSVLEVVGNVHENAELLQLDSLKVD